MVTLQTLVGEIKQTPVGMDFLRARVPGKVGVMNYLDLKGKSRRALFSKYESIIVLIPKKGQKLGHYVCLTGKRNHIEYFSSLGNSWETELALLQEPTKIFRTLLGKDYIYNRAKLQNDQNYKIQDCAAFVLCRVYLRHLKLREFVTLFRNISLENPDDVASMLVVLLFANKNQ